jgi:hypothetical protein
MSNTLMSWLLLAYTALASLGWGWLVIQAVPHQYDYMAAGIGGLVVGVVGLHLIEEVSRR